MTGDHRPHLQITAAVVAAAASLTLAACQAGDSSPAGTPTATPPAIETTSPAPSPSPAADTWPPTELEELSAAAPIDDGEPTVYEAPDWLADWVDDSWSTAIYSTVDVADDGSGLEGVQWLYLVAPDGAAFRIADLGHDANATIVDWDPSHAKVWLYFQGMGESWNVAEVDLATGRVASDDFTDGAGPRGTVAAGELSQDLLPRAASDDGKRLWAAVSPFGDTGGVVWYSPDTGTWEASAVNDVMFDIAAVRYARGDVSEHSPGNVHGSGWVSITHSRSIYLVEDEGGEGSDAPAYVLIDHDLSEDAVVQAAFTPPDSASWCSVAGPKADDVLLSCSNSDMSVPDTAWVVDPDTGEASEVRPDTNADAGHDLGSYTEDMKAQGTMPPNADAWTDLMPAPQVP